jgi:hypothetical protein
VDAAAHVADLVAQLVYKDPARHQHFHRYYIIQSRCEAPKNQHSAVSEWAMQNLLTTPDPVPRI